jgi:hypothetical protein
VKSIDKVFLLLDNTAPFGGVPERSKGSDCKSDAKASVVRIHLPPPDKVVKGGYSIAMVRLTLFDLSLKKGIFRPKAGIV